MHAGTHVPAIGHPAGVPRRPSSGSCRAGDVGGIGFEVVELVCGVFTDGTAEDGEEH